MSIARQIRLHLASTCRKPAHVLFHLRGICRALIALL